MLFYTPLANVRLVYNRLIVKLEAKRFNRLVDQGAVGLQCVHCNSGLAYVVFY